MPNYQKKRFYLLLFGLVFTLNSLAQSSGGQNRLGPVINNAYGEVDPSKQAYAFLEVRLKDKFQARPSNNQNQQSPAGQVNSALNVQTLQVSVKLLADLQNQSKRSQIEKAINEAAILNLQSNARAEEKQGNYARAIGYLTDAAQKGDQSSMYHTGYLLANGIGGFDKDSIAALNWFKCAALIDKPLISVKGMGDSSWIFDRVAIIYSLGYKYFWGENAPVNYTESYGWFKMLDKDNWLDVLNRKLLDKKQVIRPTAYFEAMAYLGFMIADGQGTTKNEKRALSYFKKSAETNLAGGIILYAQLKSSLLYYKGGEVSKDYDQAFTWIKKAADGNDSMAQYIVAGLYELGKGTFKSVPAAVQYYKKAADASYTPAIGRLAHIYQNGFDVPTDYKQALFWYIRAANQGSSNDMYNCGAMYEMGNGLLQDREQQFYAALFWYRQAEAYGNTEAKIDIKRINGKLKASSKDAFDIDNYLKKGSLQFQKLASGVRYYVARANNNPRPLEGDTVELNVFVAPADFSGTPDKNPYLWQKDWAAANNKYFKKTVSVIKYTSNTAPGLNEGLLYLREGERGMFIIPTLLSAGQLDPTKTNPADRPFSTTFAFAEIAKIRPVNYYKNAGLMNITDLLSTSNPFNETRTGLKYVLSQAAFKANHINKGDTVLLNYVGRTLDNRIFDTNIGLLARAAGIQSQTRTYEPFKIIAGIGMVLPGWDEAFQLMDKGISGTFILPPRLAYGANPVPGVKPNSTVVFNLDIISVKPAKAKGQK